MFRKFLILISFVSLCFQAKGQEFSIIDKKAIKYFEEGNAFLQRKQLPEAKEKYQAAYERSTDFYEAYLKHAQVLLSSGMLEEALRVTKKGQSRIPIKANDFFKGKLAWIESQIYLAQGKFQLALDTFDANRLFLDEDFVKSADYLEKLQQFEIIAEGIKNPISISKNRLPGPLNQFKLQYFPVLTADGKRLFFTKRDGMSAKLDEDIYFSDHDGETWSSPESISELINTRFNEGTCTISADGNLLIFTSCNTPASHGSCDLYITARVDGLWQSPVNMGRNVNTRFWESQPSLSADGSLLFFSSNRPEGEGGIDIWVSERLDDGAWSKAKNLGPNINTKKDEVSPFIFFNNTVLFFASDGHPGFGAKDIYRSSIGRTGFGKPSNMGFPINDQKDQLALFITAQKDFAYYTENSYYQGKVDSSFLYRFEFPEEIDLGHKLIVTRGKVINEETGEAVEAILSLVDLERDSTMYSFKSDGKDGAFTMIYPDKEKTGLYVEKQGYMPKIYNVDRDSLRNKVGFQILLEPIASGKHFIFENIFFDFDKSILKKASISSLKKLKKFLLAHPEVNLLIVGHTDNIGDSEYNSELSLRRAESVKEYLLKEGISATRLKIEGRGSTEPIQSNDTEENRALNRRIEVFIL
ncbi:OmpA family protein [Cyclobacterium sp. 1_MG-2023]|uniref:OmpA family protein n=1 Tax=Cyclobacterium sp. 1_MG-2023 TaxID=3062681 RepID=UPI0026E32087|nr:OmpA family protein [Cyclobacterium sp. 1_MG-2023]MDO6440099.1 OmpA family protein [Cyclobacterium sp. 1_MG-2023]